MKRSSLRRNTSLKGNPAKPLKRKTKIKPVSDSPSAKERRRKRAEAKAAIKSDMSTCIWPGCKRIGTHGAHAYGTGAHPDQHDDETDIWPSCAEHHLMGLVNLHTPECVKALQDLTDERRLALQHGQAISYTRVKQRLYEAFGQVLRRVRWPARLKYAQYLRVKLPPELMRNDD